MNLAAWIAHEASKYRALDTEAGELVANHLDELAKDVQCTHARTPAEHIERNATYERMARGPAVSCTLIYDHQN